VKHSNICAAAVLSSLALGCAADPGTRPHDMSAADHQAAGDQEMRAAEGHADQHDPAATSSTKECGRGVCWTSTKNPTAQHASDAKRHRELAAKHRAASSVLVDAEARSCAGISEEDRDTSPFYHREDIQSVSPLTTKTQSGKGGVISKEVGSTVVFRAVPGLTAEWLQREVDCHIARSAAGGHNMPEMDYCPLMVKAVKATVSSVGNGFAVDISGEDHATIAEIQKRAQALSVR